MSTFELIWDTRSGVSECPTWDPATRRLLFCDIPARRIHALHIDTGARETWEFPEVVGSFGLCESGRLVVLGVVQDAVARLAAKRLFKLIRTV